MSELLRERVVSTFHLTDDQRQAALERERDVVVTAGAGSGKTRTLVARYASLLADGLEPRSVTAITFTEKAAREMRSRVRQALNDLVRGATDEAERRRWVALNAEMDAARIGTIHSLCAEMLRAHPAEACIDPRFDVIDEGAAAALRAELVADTLARLAEQELFTPLFRIFETRDLKDMLDFLLSRRLEAQEAFTKEVDPRQALLEALRKALDAHGLASGIAELRALSAFSGRLEADAGPTLAPQVEGLLAEWGQAEAALGNGDAWECAGFLFEARRQFLKKGAGKANSIAKAVVSDMQAAYDALLNPLLGGAGAKDKPLSAESEADFVQARALIARAFDMLLRAYQEALRERRALDFDDLEYGAVRLLMRADIRARWQGEIDALLVDEFQDTNERQRAIVYALCGQPGRMFVVGDARQSIYRFRRADVTVFREVQRDVLARGGLVINLDQTYRAHEPLLDAAGDLLGALMGTEEKPDQPYYVPFSPLRAVRKHPPEHMRAPHMEVVLGVGADAAAARPEGARALAQRLHQLRNAGQIGSWDDVTLLLRASTGFAAYENAFEDAGIPFVTVAGRGFYDRPEIRDVLNILRALADPADDLAMAGLLRSPAFGLTDAALYQLRWDGQAARAYWQALQGEMEALSPADRALARRARGIVAALLPRVDRTPVFELLKSVIDATDYRAVLAAGERGGAGGRLWRNLDKLLADAYDSGQVSVREFLKYLETLNSAGAREGEAPAEAQGAVRLMTIHKSKGLEFPVVVLADASREPRGGSEAFILSGAYGLAFKLDPPPLLYRLAKDEDGLQSAAEAQRLLYVALTRAQNKLLISGHATSENGSWSARAWTKDICEAADIKIGELTGTGALVELTLPCGQSLGAWALLPDTPALRHPLPQGRAAAEAEIAPLHEPLYVPPAPELDDEDDPRQPWRATGPVGWVPPEVTGKMVHKAIELWLFPGHPRLAAMLETAALDAGLVQPAQRAAAVQRAMELLGRLQGHGLYAEIEAARDCRHELPYVRWAGEHAEVGYIDILYRDAGGWQVVDFKTDAIRQEGQRIERVQRYSAQLQRYAEAVQAFTGEAVRARICFLDDGGRVEVVGI